MATKVYDPDRVAASFAGIPIRGYADGEMIKVETPEDAFTTKTGSDGETTRSKSNKNVKRVTVSLMQTSDVNDLLSFIHQTDLEASNGAGVGAFFLKDLSGRALLTAPEAWIVKAPDMTFDREATARVWVFDCVESKQVTGGN